MYVATCISFLTQKLESESIPRSRYLGLISSLMEQLVLPVSFYNGIHNTIINGYIPYLKVGVIAQKTVVRKGYIILLFQYTTKLCSSSVYNSNSNNSY